MPKSNHKIRLGELELLIIRVASIAFLILMILKLFKAELSSW
jgi:hypothetical protein